MAIYISTIKAMKHLHCCYVFYLSDEQNFEKLLGSILYHDLEYYFTVELCIKV